MKQFISALAITLIFSGFLPSCHSGQANQVSESELSKQMIGTWKRDWNKTIEYLEENEPNHIQLSNIKGVASLGFKYTFIFKEDKTVVYHVEGSMIKTKSTGTWTISDDSRTLFIEILAGTTKI